MVFRNRTGWHVQNQNLKLGLVHGAELVYWSETWFDILLRMQAYRLRQVVIRAAATGASVTEPFSELILASDLRLIVSDTLVGALDYVFASSSTNLGQHLLSYVRGKVRPPAHPVTQPHTQRHGSDTRRVSSKQP